MIRQAWAIALLATVLGVSAPAMAADAASGADDKAYSTLEWTDLIPPDDLEVLMNPPAYVTDIEDGSLEDQISGQIQNGLAAANDDRYQQALRSTRFNEELDGAKVRMPGFIVPLEFDEAQTVTQFFLVPYFGACLHMPPPPPNQIILVTSEEGVQLQELYTPFWISGELSTSVTENDVATSAYSLQMAAIEVYTE